MLRVLRWEGDVGAMERLKNLARSMLRPAVLAAATFLLVRCEVMLRASPLAAALLAAALAAGESAGAVVAGCLLGMLRLPMAHISLLPAISCVLVLGGELALSYLPPIRKWTDEFRISLVSGLAVLLPALFFANGDLPDSARALACALLAAAAAPFFMPALELRSGRTRLTLQEKTGAALLVCGCISGLMQLCAPLAEGCAVLLVLLTPGMGASSGVLAGLALYFGGGSLIKTASLALCALAGGLKICCLRWQRALLVCAAAGVTQAAAADALGFPWAACAALVYLLLPDGPVRRLREIAAPDQAENCSPERIAREATQDARRRLRALGDAFSEMAEDCTLPADVPDEQALICEMRARLCAGCSGYENCWAGGNNHAVRLLCDLIADALDRVDAPPGMRVPFADGEIPPDIMRICRRGRMIPDRLGLLLRDFAQKRRSEIKRCANNQLMSLQFMQAAEILYNLADNQARGERLSEARLEQISCALEENGIGNCRIACLGRTPVELNISRAQQGWSRDEIRKVNRVLNRSLGCRFAPLVRGDVLHFSSAPRLSADTGASCQSGVAGEICGDSHMVRQMDASRLLLAISDGMGSGDAAGAESLEALRLLWSFLDAGISRTLALDTVNRRLLMKSTEDMFATMDLCIIDMNTGVAEITKLAACRTLILRDGELLRIEGGQLPLGILDGVQPSLHRFRLRPGDTIIMGSDGVMEAGDIMMIERLARENAACPAQQLAEKLVREAALRRSGGRTDDLTCICARMGCA